MAGKLRLCRRRRRPGDHRLRRPRLILRRRPRRNLTLVVVKCCRRVPMHTDRVRGGESQLNPSLPGVRCFMLEIGLDRINPPIAMGAAACIAFAISLLTDWKWLLAIAIALLAAAAVIGAR